MASTSLAGRNGGGFFSRIGPSILETQVNEHSPTTSTAGITSDCRLHAYNVTAINNTAGVCFACSGALLCFHRIQSETHT